MTSSTPIIGTKIGRARRSLGQLWQVPTFFVGLLVFIGVAVSAPWRHGPEWHELDKLTVTIRHNLEHASTVDQGDALVADAMNALLLARQFPTRAAEVHFLAGSAYYRQALQKPALYARELWPLVVENLEKALELQVADADRPFLSYRLGYAMFQQGKETPRAIDLMMQSMDKGSEQPLQGYQLLMQANLKLKPPNVDAALAASRRILDLTPENSGDALALARIAHSELLMRKDLRVDALKELEQITMKISRPLRVKARLLQARCCEEEGLWPQAIGLWQELLKDATQVEGGRARIHYALGWCYHEMDPPKIPETVSAWTAALQEGGPAGLAAGLYLGDMRISLGEKQYSQALADWKQALENVTADQEFHNAYIKREEVKKLFDHALHLFQDKQDPQKTQEVAELYRKIAPGGSAEDKLAAAEKALAVQMQKDGKSTPEAVIAQFRRAAIASEKAVLARPAPERPATLWRTVQCYLSARESQSALELLRQFVQLEKDEGRLAEGWFTIGDIYRTQNDKKNAHAAFVKCIDCRNGDTPFAYRSRYYLAAAEMEAKNYEQAKSILEQNLYRGNLEQDRPSQEKSQYMMASLLMKMRTYPLALVHLKECIRLYPDNPNVILAREQLGECFRYLAEKELLQEDEIIKQVQATRSEDSKQRLEDQLSHHRKTRNLNLDEAIKAYLALAADLETRDPEEKPLNDIERLLLRRALFGSAECLFDKLEYDEGLRLFQRLLKNHRQTTESSYAALRICNVAEVIKAPAERAQKYTALAKESLQLLKEDLKTMAADHELFRATNGFTREQWQNWTEDMQKKLNAPPQLEAPPSVLR